MEDENKIFNFMKTIKFIIIILIIIFISGYWIITQKNEKHIMNFLKKNSYVSQDNNIYNLNIKYNKSNYISNISASYVVNSGEWTKNITNNYNEYQEKISELYNGKAMINLEYSNKNIEKGCQIIQSATYNINTKKFECKINQNSNTCESQCNQIKNIIKNFANEIKNAKK